MASSTAGGVPHCPILPSSPIDVLAARLDALGHSELEKRLRVLGTLTFISALAGLLLTVSTTMAQAPDAVGDPARKSSLVQDPVGMTPLEPCMDKLRTGDASTDSVGGSLKSPGVGRKAAVREPRAPCEDVFATTDLAHKRSCAALVVEKANLSPEDSVTAMRLLGLLFEMKR